MSYFYVFLTGDSGGPLMLGNTVIGVSNFVSQGKIFRNKIYQLCAVLILSIEMFSESLINHIPQAFASVYYHMKWIKKTTGLKFSKTKC